MGVAGAQVSANTVLVTGLAGLLAGAGSMAMGEWVSVQSARELAGHQLETEAREIDEIPDEEREELALIYEAKGLDAAQARELAARQMADRSTALDTLAREELGIDPEELGGSAAVVQKGEILMTSSSPGLPTADSGGSLPEAEQAITRRLSVQYGRRGSPIHPARRARRTARRCRARRAPAEQW